MARTTKTGLKSNNVVLQDGASWEDILDINVDELTSMTRDNFFVRMMGNEKHRWCEALYTGATSIATPLTSGNELDNFPTGSTIVEVVAQKLWVKVSSTTWGYGTLATG